MRNLTAAEVGVLAPRVQSAAETTFVNFKKLLEQPEYEDLAATVDTENFDMFLIDESLYKSLPGFKSIEVSDDQGPTSNIHATASVCFAFKPFRGAAALTISPAVGSYGIGSTLDRQAGAQVNVNHVAKEHLWVYLEAAGPGEDSEFANLIIGKAGLHPEDYCLLIRIEFKFLV